MFDYGEHPLVFIITSIDGLAFGIYEIKSKAISNEQYYSGR
jgi:hypothetical protein